MQVSGPSHMPCALDHAVGWHRRGQPRSLLTSQCSSGLNSFRALRTVASALQSWMRPPSGFWTYPVCWCCAPLPRCMGGSFQSSRCGGQRCSPEVLWRGDEVGEVARPWMRRARNPCSALGCQWASRPLPGPVQRAILNLTLEFSRNFCGCIRVRAGVEILLGRLRADQCSNRP